MNRILQISLFILLFGACQNNQEESTSVPSQEQSNQVITEVTFISDGSKLYAAGDSSDFSIRVSAHKGQVVIYFNLSDIQSFKSQIEELKLVLSQAEEDFNLDSIQRVVEWVDALSRPIYRHVLVDRLSYCDKERA